MIYFFFFLIILDPNIKTFTHTHGVGFVYLYIYVCGLSIQWSNLFLALQMKQTQQTTPNVDHLKKKHMNWTRFKRQIPICVCFLYVSLSHYLLFRCLAEFWCFEHFGATFIHLGCGMFHIIRNICSHLSQFFVCCWLDSRCFALHIVHFLLFDSLTQQ